MIVFHVCAHIRLVPIMIIAQEHAGNDPTTQLVPTTGGSGTWTKPEEETPITLSSTWGSGPWQPPVNTVPVLTQPVIKGLADRMLNPAEYPSLAASAKTEAGGSFTAGKLEQTVCCSLSHF